MDLDDNVGCFKGMPGLRLGPEWGEPLRMCAECNAEEEVGAKDPDDGMWYALPLNHLDGNTARH